MKSLRYFAMIMFLVTANILQAQQIKPGEVKAVMKKVADWQMEHFRDTYSGYEVPHHELDWTNAALYSGMVKWAAMASACTPASVLPAPCRMMSPLQMSDRARSISSWIERPFFCLCQPQ